jgi:hypothetical protein
MMAKGRSSVLMMAKLPFSRKGGGRVIRRVGAECRRSRRRGCVCHRWPGKGATRAASWGKAMCIGHRRSGEQPQVGTRCRGSQHGALHPRRQARRWHPSREHEPLLQPAAVGRWHEGQGPGLGLQRWRRRVDGESDVRWGL